jgi:hypothetical protein
MRRGYSDEVNPSATVLLDYFALYLEISHIGWHVFVPPGDAFCGDRFQIGSLLL